MTDDDPRHREKFGAGYALGLATAGISVWCPAALYGPRGVISDFASWPIQDALKPLSGLAGHPVHSAKVTGGAAVLHVGVMHIEVNLTCDANGTLGPFAWTALR